MRLQSRYLWFRWSSELWWYPYDAVNNDAELNIHFSTDTIRNALCRSSNRLYEYKVDQLLGQNMSEEQTFFEISRDVGNGNRDWVSLTYSPLDVTSLINSTKARRAGAVSTFLGTTREFFEDKDVVHLEYEAYTDMALQTMLEICDKVIEYG